MVAILSPVEQRWECPSCDVQAVTHRAPVKPGESATEFHHCAGLASMWAPMVPAGTRCKSVAVEREDYVGDQDVRYDDDGRPIMAVSVVRDDGEDRAVYAPTAHLKLGDLL